MNAKFKFLVAGAIVATSVAGIARAATDDLILQSRLDQKSLSWLIDKTRVIMANADLSDGLTNTVNLPDDPQFGLSDISSDPGFAEVRTLMTQVFHVDMAGAVLRVRIPKIYYKIASIKANPKILSVNDPVLAMTATAMLSGLDIGLVQGVQIDLMIPNKITHVMQSYMTATVEPTSVSIPTTLPPVTFDLSFQAIRDQRFHFNLTSYNLDALPKYVKDHEQELVIQANSTHQALTVDQIKVNPVIVRLGPFSRTLTFDSFKPLIQRKLNDILGQVILGVGVSLKTTLGPQVLNTVFSLSTTSDLEASTDAMYVRYDVANFAQPAHDQLAFAIAGSMCTPDLYKSMQGACTEQEPALIPNRVITDSDRMLAKNEITAKLASGDADVVASVTEEYVNRLLKTVMGEASWTSQLAASFLSFGDKGAFVVFNRATTTPDLILDLKYSGDGSFPEKLFINENHPLHFPLRMSTSLAFSVRDGKSFLTLNTENVLSDVDEIINGLPEYGMSSTLIWGLKRKVAKMIIKMAGEQGKQAIDMELPMFKNVGLEHTFYEVSPYGRVNLYFKL
jgi:hypothetical protein